MPNQYRIVVRNRAQKFQRFLLFNEAPQAGTKSAKAVAWSNVWAVAPGVPGPHGKTDFKIVDQVWAVSGTAPQQLNDKVIVETSDAAQVDLEVGNTSGTMVWMSVREGGAGFDPQKSGASEVPGGFTIQTGKYNGPDYPHVFVGLGRQNPKARPGDEDILPVAVWAADPNQTYEIIPHQIYYIATGDFKLGEIVDYRNLGKIAKIDFSSGAGIGKDVAVVDFLPTYEYSPVRFSYSESDNGPPQQLLE